MPTSAASQSGSRAIRWYAGVVVVAGLAAVAGVWAVHGPALEAPWVAVAFVALFALADRNSVHVDVRDHSVATSATEVLLMVGFFLLAPFELLAARAVGGLAYRLADVHIKNVVNTGLMLLSTSVAILLAFAAGPPGVDRPVTWLAALGGLLVAAVLDIAVIGGAVRVSTGARVQVPAAVAGLMLLWGLASGSVSLSGVLLASIRPVAVLLAFVPGAVIVLGYRAFVRQRHDAARLRTLYELTNELGRGELETVVADVVVEARELLRCHVVALVVRGGRDDGEDLVVRVDQQGQLATDLAAGTEVPSWATLAEAGDGELTHESVAVPVANHDELVGFLVAAGLPRGRDHFGAADRTALRALADRVGSVVARGRLTQQLDTAAAATRFLESHDVLTGLGNRRWFVAELERLAAAHDTVVVALCNLRGFRRVNESVGQAAGDLLLVETADALRATLPDTAAVARLAGDEFAVAVPGDAVVDVELAVGRPVTSQLRGQLLSLPIAAGMAVWPADVDRSDGLLRAADIALVVARRQVRGGVVRYDAELEETIARRGRLATDLRTALAEGVIEVHFQPLADVAGGEVVAVEALARWTHPDLGPIRPDEFVGIAEESGQVGALTRHVLGIATRQAAAWAAAGHPVEVAVNISALDLDGAELVDDVRIALVESHLPPERLVLEVTETAMMTDRARASATLDELAALGVGLAIDDFGTGHSSLAYLQDLPVTEIKVDRLFVDDLLDNDQSELIVRTVVELAARRGLVVVAEGVEDGAVLARLAELGVQRAQGWHLGRPVPAREIRFSPASATDPETV